MQNVKQARNANNKCKEHKKNYNSFCTSCNCHLCAQCNISPHQQHQIIFLSLNENIKIMRRKLNEAYAHINKKCNIIKLNTICDLINQN